MYFWFFLQKFEIIFSFLYFLKSKMQDSLADIGITQ